ncbi:MAG TPA: hypothetical protein VFE05_12280 [Longimicrobiaceae bacterium]|nr:hypothetical protein [Longimicrobiaceae bacterium]
MKSSRFIIAVAAVALIAACSSGPPPKKKGPPVIIVRADQAAVIDSAHARGVFDQCSRGVPFGITGYWTPSKDDIRKLEAALPAYLHGIKLPESDAPAGASWRQYAGFIRNGRRLIYINAFPGPPLYPGDYWHREAEAVCDGGAPYWGLVYDPQSNAFGEMQFNTDAATRTHRH